MKFNQLQKKVEELSLKQPSTAAIPKTALINDSQIKKFEQKLNVMEKQAATASEQRPIIKKLKEPETTVRQQKEEPIKLVKKELEIHEAVETMHLMRSQITESMVKRVSVFEKGFKPDKPVITRKKETLAKIDEQAETMN